MLREFRGAFWQLSFWGVSPGMGSCSLGLGLFPPYCQSALTVLYDCYWLQFIDVVSNCEAKGPPS